VRSRSLPPSSDHRKLKSVITDKWIEINEKYIPRFSVDGGGCTPFSTGSFFRSALTAGIAPRTFQPRPVADRDNEALLRNTERMPGVQVLAVLRLRDAEERSVDDDGGAKY
jgi:hypothetical protein